MVSFLYSIAGFLVAVGLLVTVHEWGHFIAARMVGVRVLKFSIGFGRPLWQRVGGADRTTYAIGLIPLGGYVRMLDETQDDVRPSERKRAFNNKSLVARSFVVIAGPLANFLFAILVYWIIFVFGIVGVEPIVGLVQSPSPAHSAGFLHNDRILTINQREVRTWHEHRLFMLDRVLDGKPLEFEVIQPNGPRRTLSMDTSDLFDSGSSPAQFESYLGVYPQLPELPAIVGAVLDDGAAHQAGLKAGDRIVMVDGQPVGHWRELVGLISKAENQNLLLRIERNREQIEKVVRPQAVVVDDAVVGRIGIAAISMDKALDGLPVARSSITSALGKALESTWLTTSLTLKLAYLMIRQKASSENLSGPISIAQYAGRSAQGGFVPFMTFLALVSVSLGVLNLLPIPLLDGGHLLYFLIEAITGRPLSGKTIYRAQKLGIGLLAVLFTFAFYNDIARLFS